MRPGECLEGLDASGRRHVPFNRIDFRQPRRGCARIQLDDPPHSGGIFPAAGAVQSHVGTDRRVVNRRGLLARKRGELRLDGPDERAKPLAPAARFILDRVRALGQRRHGGRDSIGMTGHDGFEYANRCVWLTVLDKQNERRNRCGILREGPRGGGRARRRPQGLEQRAIEIRKLSPRKHGRGLGPDAATKENLLWPGPYSDPSARPTSTARSPPACTTRTVHGLQQTSQS